jgi:hypothetical protein
MLSQQKIFDSRASWIVKTISTRQARNLFAEDNYPLNADELRGAGFG